MRRDLIHYFLAGIACTSLMSLLVYLAMESVQFTIATALFSDSLLVLSLWLAYRRRKQWRGMFPDDPLKSRELRCQMAKMIGRTEHRFV
jgi:hypothetical protein